MIWVLGYLIGVILCALVLLVLLLTDNSEDDETTWLVSVIWPFILIGYFLVLVYAVSTHFIDKYGYIIKNKTNIKEKEEKK